MWKINTRAPLTSAHITAQRRTRRQFARAERAVVAFGPDVMAGRGIDQLGAHPNAIADAADAALEGSMVTPEGELTAFGAEVEAQV